MSATEPCSRKSFTAHCAGAAKSTPQLGRHLQRSLAETDSSPKPLRVTLYQLLFLDKVPAYAAVNEAVEIAKHRGGKKASGFVNGVLRNFLRQKERPGETQNDNESSVANLAAEYSHPQWLVQALAGSISATSKRKLLMRK